MFQKLRNDIKERILFPAWLPDILWNAVVVYDNMISVITWGRKNLFEREGSAISSKPAASKSAERSISYNSHFRGNKYKITHIKNSVVIANLLENVNILNLCTQRDHEIPIY